MGNVLKHLGGHEMTHQACRFGSQMHGEGIACISPFPGSMVTHGIARAAVPELVPPIDSPAAHDRSQF